MRGGTLFYCDRKIFYDAKGYACVWKDGKSKKVHILEWESHNGPKPEGFELHHRDGDKGNWHIENLELLTNSDHQRTHAGWIRSGGEWVKKPCSSCGGVFLLSDFYPRKGRTPSAKCRPCHNKSAAEWGKRNSEKRRIGSLSYYYRSKADA